VRTTFKIFLLTGLMGIGLSSYATFHNYYCDCNIKAGEESCSCDDPNSNKMDKMEDSSYNFHCTGHKDYRTKKGKIIKSPNFFDKVENFTFKAPITCTVWTAVPGTLKAKYRECTNWDAFNENKIKWDGIKCKANKPCPECEPVN
jgi:hypothetical protein